MSLSMPASAAITIGFPRVSGDEPTMTTYRRKGLLFSPRERG